MDEEQCGMGDSDFNGKRGRVGSCLTTTSKISGVQDLDAKLFSVPLDRCSMLTLSQICSRRIRTWLAGAELAWFQMFDLLIRFINFPAAPLEAVDS